MTQTVLSQVTAAIHFAAQKHRQQRRKGLEQTPYINHPIELMKILALDAEVQDPVVLMAALLHDTVEDTDASLEEIRQHFGADVAAVVEQLTDDKSLPREKRKQLQVEHAASMSDRAKLVKLADKISNIREIGQSPPAGWSLERCLEYCDWGKRVVDQMRGTHTQLEALFDQVYTQSYTACQQKLAAKVSQ